ncbi:methyl-accepting chemotaxis protein [Desulfobotulus alkaliphilus]|uniref:Methyl-accepting chemotaxis protein n=1 Tax=Desulfobotulus alkaliphilus TaxID=622671 RepID=A0A562S725_9BACT|nr:methyl-accepting chemotaxis protein [Desulfobotulus alkaliphilus]TWI77209.1 methyl-accepting chemotaxis protein [Desulfobotulus alkaliphilus]
MKFKDLSVRWKILAIVASGPLVVALILAVMRVGDIRRGAEEGILEKSRAIVLMAEAARNEMAKKLEMGVMRPYEELERHQIMEAVPVITALNMAASNAEEAGYRFRAPKINPRNPVNRPDAVEEAVLRELAKGQISEKIIFEKDQVRYFKAITLTQECMACHGDPKGTRDPVGGIREGWKVGEVHGAFQIISSLEDAHRAVARARISVALWVLGILSVVVGLGWWQIRRNVLRPLNLSESITQAVASGDLTRQERYDSEDEFGRMVKAMNTMSSELRTMMGSIGKSGVELQSMTDDLGRISELLNENAEENASRANSVAAASEEMSSNMNSVAAAVEQTTTNVSMVAQAAEQMTETINEIASNSERARAITEDAVAQAEEASRQMETLGNAAREVGQVTETINNISDQTNLLALNATIEAARAGDAGKGFAVVANEIKELARQTGNATEEIREKIDGIQQSTSLTVDRIAKILTVIQDVNAIVVSIATAVEEQSNTTREIADNVVQASQGIQEMNHNVSEASIAASEIAKDIVEVHRSTDDVVQSSRTLNQQASSMRKQMAEVQSQVQRFRI